MRRFETITYCLKGFQVPNAVSSWMPFKFNADGSLDLYFQNESPGLGMEAELERQKGHST
jgi:hypothetical protein